MIKFWCKCEYLSIYIKLGLLLSQDVHLRFQLTNSCTMEPPRVWSLKHIVSFNLVSKICGFRLELSFMFCLIKLIHYKKKKWYPTTILKISLSGTSVSYHFSTILISSDFGSRKSPFIRKFSVCYDNIYCLKFSSENHLNVPMTFWVIHLRLISGSWKYLYKKQLF